MHRTRAAGLFAAICAVPIFAAAPPARADEALVDAACGQCHAAEAAGPTRISGQRKTPEGWLMTIVRMRVAHGLDVSAADQAALVTYLSDTRGLAPSETVGWRYALEKDPDVVEAIDPPLDQMCARCHTGARVMLQRRTAEEWLLHMDFHVGQFPTVEYQALGRDREWYAIARDDIAPLLAEKLPLDMAVWEAWLAAPQPTASGDWIVLADMPGHGQAYGALTVTGDASPYDVSGTLTTAAGDALPVSGRMNFYSGYEWRANLTIGGEEWRQVLAVSEDGERLEGRQFLRGADSIGGRLTGAKAGGAPAILGVAPAAAPAGQAVAAQVVGDGLSDLTVAATGGAADAMTANALGAAVTLTAEGDARFTFEAGGDAAQAALYASVDRIAVEPPFTIARVGGGEGPGRVPAHFKAIGFWNGPDGEPGTEDDVRIGEIPAEWSTDNHSDAAAAMEDAKYAGTIDAALGIFTPGIAGPNPDRKFSTNNAGELKVIAHAAGHEAEAQLIVTVQRFIDPPIR